MGGGYAHSASLAPVCRRFLRARRPSLVQSPLGPLPLSPSPGWTSLRLHEASIAMTPVFWVRGPAVRAPGDGNTDWFAGAVGAKLT